jgi:sugar O-acyltransferase (sialic acid O-acetyltransferase NeuD family)
MDKETFIIGAGGMAREAFSIYIDLGREKDVMGFLEEDCHKDGVILNGKPVHDISFLSRFNEQNKPLVIGAIGSTKRKNLLMKLEKEGYRFDTIVHPSAILSRWVKISDGSIVTAGVIMTFQIDIGRHVIINLGSRIAHDVRIGNYATLSPGSKVMGHASLGDEVYVGTNATIIEGITVGKGAIIAAGAVVVKDVPEMTLVAGVPAVVKKIYKSPEEKPW